MTEDEFRDVYRFHARPVWGYVLRRTDDIEDASDVVSDTFLTAWRRREELPTVNARLPWLLGVARRTLANHRRGQRRRSRLDERVNATLVPLLAHADDARSERIDVGRALDGLPADDRELLRLTAWEQLSPREIATVLDLRPATVRTRLHRARLRARVAFIDAGIGIDQPPEPATTPATSTTTRGAR